MFVDGMTILKMPYLSQIILEAQCNKSHTSVDYVHVLASVSMHMCGELNKITLKHICKSKGARITGAVESFSLPDAIRLCPIGPCGVRAGKETQATRTEQRQIMYPHNHRQ